MSVFLQVLIGAILQGALYTLGAVGLSLSFGVLKILNLSHGDFLMLGGLLGFLALVHLGINPFISAAGVAVIGLLVGAVFYRLLIARIVGRSFRQMLITSVMTTLGVALVIEDLTSFLWGGGSTGIPFQMRDFVVGGVVFPGLRLTLLAGTIFLTFALHLFLSRTFIGRAIVASSVNRVGAIVVGINTEFVAVVTFSIGIALAAGTGVFYATLYSIEPFMGLALTLKYLAVIIIGGMGSLMGAMVGGFIVAAVEAYTSYFVGAEWAPMTAFVILIIALLVRPQGLLGRGE
ncbi:MAG: branched-chain amino acid ABC transporter permease [Alphaproteobacteria bacterium]|nr:branched-chain amino acid ABC transporter permease [Alphaproteobacteria bacterium]